jgi:hypothetical protein
LFGEETSGNFYLGDLSTDEVEKGGFLIPPPLWQRLQISAKAKFIELDSGLFWKPYEDAYITYG